jgi:hypothetical protein
MKLIHQQIATCCTKKQPSARVGGTCQVGLRGFPTTALHSMMLVTEMIFEEKGPTVRSYT